MVWEGENVVRMGRQMLGETNPQASAPGTIRGDFSIVVGRNICHGSDSVASAWRAKIACKCRSICAMPAAGYIEACASMGTIWIGFYGMLTSVRR
jgi:hypothetical protein